MDLLSDLFTQLLIVTVHRNLLLRCFKLVSKFTTGPGLVTDKSLLLLTGQLGITG